MDTTFGRYIKGLPLVIFPMLLMVLLFNIWFYHYGPLRHRIYSPLTNDDSLIYEREILSETPPSISLDNTNNLPVLSADLTLQKGQTFSQLLSNANVTKQEALAAIKSISKVFKLAQLQAGQKILLEFAINEQETSKNAARYLDKITIYTSASSIKAIRQANGLFKADISKAILQEKRRYISGRISGSLYSAAIRAGANANMVANFIKLFSYTTDFQRDIKAGDKFEFLTTYYVDQNGKIAREGEIIYASLCANGKAKSIYRFDKGKGDFDYFDQHGNSIKKTLLRTPINGARVSSGYGMRRHPILGYSRMHKGLDYAAPRGTPIGAAGDGVVQFVRMQPNGYGKYLTIKHNNKYTTLYAHLDRIAKGIYPGKKVKQGEVVAYVGSSGMSTAPHLHYEVLVMGKQVNPAKVSFAKIPPLKGRELEKFQKTKNLVDSSIVRSTS
jgi:murein DD-endopeptidase MepM/ murein hydrolase activator NlpD